MYDYLRIMLNARLARMDDRGASAVEYALMVASMALVIIAVVAGFVTVLHSTFSSSCNHNAAQGTTC